MSTIEVRDVLYSPPSYNSIVDKLPGEVNGMIYARFSCFYDKLLVTSGGVCLAQSVTSNKVTNLCWLNVNKQQKRVSRRRGHKCIATKFKPQTALSGSLCTLVTSAFKAADVLCRLGQGRRSQRQNMRDQQNGGRDQQSGGRDQQNGGRDQQDGGRDQQDGGRDQQNGGRDQQDGRRDQQSGGRDQARRGRGKRQIQPITHFVETAIIVDFSDYSV